MQPNPILSIIIPFYNVEQYIAQCLESVFAQDIPEEKYEVICVNDGSPDNSREIVKEFQKEHANLILVEHDVNKKLGAARNTGRKIAKGKYIWNVDSDDFIKPNVLKKILEVCEYHELDVLMFNHDVFFDGVDAVKYDYRFKDSKLYSGKQYVDEFFKGKIGEIGQIWGKIYKLDYLNNKGIYSPEINMAEDGPYTWRSLIFAERVKSVSDVFYNYRMNQSSLTSAISKKPTSQLLYERAILFNLELFQIIDELVSDDEQSIKENLVQIVKYTIATSVKIFYKLSFKQKIEFINRLRSNKDILIKFTPYLDMKKKVALKLLI